MTFIIQGLSVVEWLFASAEVESSPMTAAPCVARGHARGSPSSPGNTSAISFVMPDTPLRLADWCSVPTPSSKTSRSLSRTRGHVPEHGEQDAVQDVGDRVSDDCFSLKIPCSSFLSFIFWTELTVTTQLLSGIFSYSISQWTEQRQSLLQLGWLQHSTLRQDIDNGLKVDSSATSSEFSTLLKKLNWFIMSQEQSLNPEHYETETVTS